MTEINPIDDRVFVRQPRLDYEQKTSSGLFIPQVAVERPMTVEVVAVGPGRRSKSGARIPMDVKPGDSVFIGRWTGTEVEIDGETLLVIRESDILAVESDSE